jgi:pimeloyl-ACP methyl ester carboxylesterase
MNRNQSSIMNLITRSSWLLAASAFALSLMACDPFAKVASAIDDVQGIWVGWLETPKQHLRLLVRIDSVSSEKVNGNSILQGSITSPDQSSDILPLRDAMLSDAGVISFSVAPPSNPNAGYSFVGKQVGDAVEGELKQGDVTLLLRLNKAASIPEEGKERLAANSAWVGNLDLGGRKLPLRFRVYSKPPYGSEERPRVVFDSLTEKANGFEVTMSAGKDSTVEFSIPAIPGKAKYIAKLDEGKTGLIGKFQQGFLPLPLEMHRVEELETEPIDSDALVQLVEKTPHGAPPVVEVPWENDNDSEAGSDTQKESQQQIVQLPDGLREESFVIDRVDLRKPKYDGKKLVDRDYQLSGTITWPAGATAESKLPAVVMITGSGPQDRDETIGPHKPFRDIAHFLARNGMTVLRYDDRGVGQSTGDFVRSTTADFADDAVSVWQHARTIEGIDKSRVGLLGHSEGGIIAPMVAAWQREVAFLVLLAPPSLPGSEILKSQIDRISEIEGVDAESRAGARLLQADLQRIAMAFAPDDERALGEVRKAISQRWDSLKNLSAGTAGSATGPEAEAIKKRVIEQVTLQFEQLRSPWMRYFLAYDPSSNWVLHNSPTLAIWGELDTQVLPGPNMERLESIIERNVNLNAELAILPHLNHLLQTAKTGLPSEYEGIRESISTTALDCILKWLNSAEILP